MDGAIDWTAFSRYWSPIPGVIHRVHLMNWRQNQVEYKGQQKIVLVFDVWGADNDGFSRPKEFRVGGMNALLFKDLIDMQERKKDPNLFVEIIRDKNNRYSIKPLAYVADSLQKLRVEP